MRIDTKAAERLLEMDSDEEERAFADSVALDMVEQHEASMMQRQQKKPKKQSTAEKKNKVPKLVKKKGKTRKTANTKKK